MKNMKDIGFPEYCITKEGQVWSLKVNRFLKPAMNGYGNGYLFVHIYNYEHKLINVTIHRLVARMFCKNPDPENKTQVNHIDGDKLNNHYKNLEWMTPSENTQHSNDIGVRKPTHSHEETKFPQEGEIIHDWQQYGKSELSDDDVHKACQMLQDGYRVCDVSAMTGYNRRTIQYIRDRHHLKWKHITELYDFSKIKRKEKTSPELVMKICECLQSGKTISETYKELNVERKLVANIKNRKFHKQISDNYVW